MDDGLIVPEVPSIRQAQGGLAGAHSADGPVTRGHVRWRARCRAAGGPAALMAMLLPVANSSLQARSGPLRICIAGSRLCWLRSAPLLRQGCRPCGAHLAQCTLLALRRHEKLQGVPVRACLEGWCRRLDWRRVCWGPGVCGW